MSESKSKSKNFSKEGVLSIGAIFGLIILYIFGLPFFVKAMTVSGISMNQVENVLIPLYTPLKWYIENDMLFNDELIIYYEACYRWLNIMP